MKKTYGLRKLEDKCLIIVIIVINIISVDIFTVIVVIGIINLSLLIIIFVCVFSYSSCQSLDKRLLNLNPII